MIVNKTKKDKLRWYKQRVADLAVLFGSPSTRGLRNKPTQLTAAETQPDKC